MRVPGLDLRVRRNTLIVGLTVVSALVFYALLTFRHPGSNPAAGEDFRRLISDNGRQKEYIDGRGVHVIVARYTGESPAANYTLDELNVDEYDAAAAMRGAAGEGGRPVLLPPALAARARRRFGINQFNVVASDLVALNRSLPDVRRPACAALNYNTSQLPNCSVIIVFHNEAWSTLMRTVQSAIDRSPRHLLAEIVLVDDASERSFLGRPLDVAVAQLPVRTRLVRISERAGLVRARLAGAQQASSRVLVFLDAHCECTPGWLEPLLARVWQSPGRSVVVTPAIDIIDAESFAYTRALDLHWGAFNWRLHFRWLALAQDELAARKHNITTPFRTPAMAGGLFAISREYFYAIGAYDRHMDIWGGENIEMSLRVWMCGGRVEIAPCSHVGHVFRANSPYTFPRPGGVSGVLYHNLARVALLWLGEWRQFYFRLNPEAARIRDEIDVTSRMQRVQQLNCHNFSWFLENVWPEHFFPTDSRSLGQLMNVGSGECLQRPFSSASGQASSSEALVTTCSSDDWFSPQLFVISPQGFIMTDESLCMDAMISTNSLLGAPVRIHGCTQRSRQRWTLSDRVKEGRQGGDTLQHRDSQLCLQQNAGQQKLVVRPCQDNDATQLWTFKTKDWR